MRRDPARGRARRARADAARRLGLDDPAAAPRRRGARAHGRRPHRARAARPSPTRSSTAAGRSPRGTRASCVGLVLLAPGADDARSRRTATRRSAPARPSSSTARSRRSTSSASRRTSSPRSIARTRSASCRTSSARFDGTARRRRVAHARRRAPGSARPRGDERLLGPVPARGGADAVRARTARAHAKAASREALRAAARRARAGRGRRRSRTSRSAGARSSRRPSPIRATPVSGPRPTAWARRSSESRSRAVDGVACELGVSREELVLALRSEEALDAFSDEHGIDRDEARAGDPRRPRARGRRRGARPARSPASSRRSCVRAAESVPPWLILETLERLGELPARASRGRAARRARACGSPTRSHTTGKNDSSSERSPRRR